MQFPSRSALNFLPVHCVQQQLVMSLVLVAVAALALFPPAVQAQEPTPNGFTQQGFATDSNGNPLDAKASRHQRQLDVSRLSSGVHVLRLSTNGPVKTQRMTVVR